MNDSTPEHLNEEQLARLVALREANQISRTSSGLAGVSKPASVIDQVDLAEYIINGTNPLSLYREGSL